MAKTTMLEYLEQEAKNTIKNMQNPNCINCNECCSIQTLLTEEGYQAIKEYFTSDEEGKLIFKNAHNRLKRYARNSTVYIMCPFTNEKTKKCRIYDRRPSMCRKFHCNPADLAVSNQYKASLSADQTTRQLSELFDEFYKLYPTFEQVMVKR